MAESFVKIFKCDYVAIHAVPTAEIVLTAAHLGPLSTISCIRIER